MRIVLIIFLIAHGLIHILGFVNAFGFADVQELSLPISRPAGITWLACALLFILTGILYLLKNDYWWFVSFIAIVLSQSLIFYYWQDAKFGTIANIVILIATIMALGNYQFKTNVKNEIVDLVSAVAHEKKSLITKEDINHLPLPVFKWLNTSGLVGTPDVDIVYIRQSAKIKMKPGQKNWSSATAEQYVNTKNPAFIWTVDMKMMSIIDIKGRDKFTSGKAEMLIKAFSIIPIVNAKNSDKLNIASLQRYLGEIVLYPSAALSPYIKWEMINVNSARAIMSYGGASGEGIFHFDNDGNFIKFTTFRYMNADDNAPLKEWIIDVREYSILNGIKIPSKMEVTWRLDDGDWTWYQVEVKDIKYDIEENN